MNNYNDSSMNPKPEVDKYDDGYDNTAGYTSNYADDSRLQLTKYTAEVMPEPYSSNMPANRSSRRQARYADQVIQHEDNRARLTQRALVNTAMLVNSAKQIGDAVPEAKPYCQTIVEAYAISSSFRIMRW